MTWIYSADNGSNHARLTTIREIIIGRTHKKFLPRGDYWYICLCLMNMLLSNTFPCLRNRIVLHIIPPFFNCRCTLSKTKFTDLNLQRRQRLQPREVNDHSGNNYWTNTPKILAALHEIVDTFACDWWICYPPTHFLAYVLKSFHAESPPLLLLLYTFKNKIHFLQRRRQGPQPRKVNEHLGTSYWANAKTFAAVLHQIIDAFACDQSISYSATHFLVYAIKLFYTQSRFSTFIFCTPSKTTFSDLNLQRRERLESWSVKEHSGKNYWTTTKTFAAALHEIIDAFACDQ